MRKLVSVLTVLVLGALVLPSCSGNDDFTEVVQTIDNQESNVEVTDDEEEVRPRGND